MPGFARLGDGAVNAIVRFIMTGEDLPVSGAEHSFGRKNIDLEIRNRWL